MTTTLVRVAGPEDADQIAALMMTLGYEISPQAIAEKLRRFEHTPFDEAFVAVNDDHRWVGCISVHAHELFHADGRLGRITSLVVHDNYRRKGLGTALIEAGENFLKACGCTRVEVTSADHRLGAHRFYLENRFVEDERRFLKRF